MAKGLARFSFTALLTAASLWCGCGGKADINAQYRARGGQGGQGGRGGDMPGPALHVSECESLCARTADAGCSPASCVALCATVSGVAGCQPQIEAWLDCAMTSDVTCDASGVPTFARCDIQLALAAACAATVAPPETVARSCGDYCDQIEAAGCDLTNPVGGCREACGLAGVGVSSCQSSYLAYIECAVASGGACDANGQLDPAICTAQQFVWLGCVLSTVGEATRSTGVGGSPAT